MVMTEAETSAWHSKETRLLVRTFLLEIKGRESLECHYQSPHGVRFISCNGEQVAGLVTIMEHYLSS